MFVRPSRPGTPNIDKLMTLSNTQLGMLSGDKQAGKKAFYHLVYQILVIIIAFFDSTLPDAVDAVANHIKAILSN